MTYDPDVEGFRVEGERRILDEAPSYDDDHPKRDALD